MARTSATRNRIDPSLSRIRSAVTNGSAILDHVDHRSAWMRRLRDLVQAHEIDLGGPDLVSESERRLIRRCAMLTLQLEMMETRWAENDGQANIQQLDAYQRTTGALRRTLETLGLQRRTKPVPGLHDEGGLLDQLARERPFEWVEGDNNG